MRQVTVEGLFFLFSSFCPCLLKNSFVGVFPLVGKPTPVWTGYLHSFINSFMCHLPFGDFPPAHIILLLRDSWWDGRGGSTQWGWHTELYSLFWVRKQRQSKMGLLLAPFPICWHFFSRIIHLKKKSIFQNYSAFKSQTYSQLEFTMVKTLFSSRYGPSVLIILGSCICKFAYSLKMYLYPQKQYLILSQSFTDMCRAV